jgi:predicted Zn-dependent protease
MIWPCDTHPVREWDHGGVQAMLSTLDPIGEGAEEENGPELAVDTPAPADRVQKVQAAVRGAAVAGTPVSNNNRDAYRRRIDGLVFGDNPEQGIVRGRSFLHPKMRIGLEFPDGWTIDNSPRQVVARAPQQNLFLVLQLVERPAGRNIEEIALNMMQGSGFALRAAAARPSMASTRSSQPIKAPSKAWAPSACVPPMSHMIGASS